VNALDETRRSVEQAIGVLQNAIDRLHPPRDEESLEDVALRLRGSAVLAHTAGLELAFVAGVHRAAHAAADAGVLSGDEGSESDG
jgi:hypothetical protein